MRPASRLDGIELSLIRQINALATPLSINLGIGEPNIAPTPELRELASGIAASGSWKYTQNAGLPQLRDAIAAIHRFSYDPLSEICVTAGTQEAIFAIGQAFLEPGDEVLVPDPGFLSYATVARMCGATVKSYDLGAPDWHIDINSIERALTPKTKLIFVNSPSNPTGGVASRSTLETIAELAAARGMLVVSDEVYSEIHYGPVPASLAGSNDSVIVLSGMSKSHAMTGLRLGWIAARAHLMKPLVTAHQYIATCASVFAQQLALAILEQPELNTAWLDHVRTEFRVQRDAALHAVRKELHTETVAPGGAFYLFVPVPTCDTVGFAKALATDAAVLVVPGVAFGRNGEGFIRISYAASPDVVHHGIRRIGEYLQSHGR